MQYLKETCYSYKEADQKLRSAVAKILYSINGLEDYYLCEVSIGPSTWRYRLYLVARPKSLSLLLLQMLKEQLDLKYPVDFVPIDCLPRNEDGNVNHDCIKKIPCISETNINILNQKSKELYGKTSKIDTVGFSENFHDQRFWHTPTVFPESITTTVNADTHKSQQLNSGSKENNKEHKLAWIKGEPIIIPKNSATTLLEALENTARIYPGQGIHTISAKGKRSFISYSNLLDKTRSVATGIKRIVIEPRRAAIILSQDIESLLVAFWGAMWAGLRPVIVSPGTDYDSNHSEVEKFWHTWNLLDKPPVLCCDTLKKNLESIKTQKVGITLSIRELTNNPATDKMATVGPSDIAFYQLTSGSTGQPKCIEERHNAVITHILSVTQCCGHLSDDISLNWLPFDHVGPLIAYHLRDTFLGRQQIHVDTAWILSKPIRWLELMSEFQVTDSWSPNFGYKILLEALKNKGDFTLNSPLRLKRLMNGGEPINKNTIQDLGNWLTQWGLTTDVIQPSFGMAETATSTTFENLFSLEESIHSLDQLQEDGDERQYFISLGNVVPGAEIRIVDERHQVLPENHIGHIQFKGPMVTTGYHVNPSVNPNVNNNLVTNDGWFNSGDIGLIDKSRLFVTGRSKEILIINGANYSCNELETSVEKVDGVKLTHVAAVGWLSDSGEHFAILFVPDHDDFPPCDRAQPNTYKNVADVCQRIKEKLAREFGISPTYVVPLPKSDFLKTTSGKIRRESMRNEFRSGKYLSQQQIIDRINSDFQVPVVLYRHIWVPCNAQPDMVMPNRVLYISNCKKLEKYIAETSKYPLNIVSIENILYTQDHELNENSIDRVVLLANPKDTKYLISLGEKLYEVQKTFERTHLLFLVSKSELIVTNSGSTLPKSIGFIDWLRWFSKKCFRWSCRHIDLDEKSCSAKTVDVELCTLVGREIAYRDGKRYANVLQSTDQPVPAAPTFSTLIKNSLCLVISDCEHLAVPLVSELLKNRFHVIAIGPKNIVDLLNNQNNGQQFACFSCDFSNIDLFIKHSQEIISQIKLSIGAIFYIPTTTMENNPQSASLSLEQNHLIHQKAKIIHSLDTLQNNYRSNHKPLLVVFSSENEYLSEGSENVTPINFSGFKEQCSHIAMNGWQPYLINWRHWEAQNEHQDLKNIYSFHNLNLYDIDENFKIKLLRLILSQRPGSYLVDTSRGSSSPSGVYSLKPSSTWNLSVEIGNDTVAQPWIDIYGNELPISLHKPKEREHTKNNGPLSNTEAEICDIFEKVFNQPINPELNIFELGGNSILLFQILYKLQDKFDRPDITISDLYNHPDLKGFAKLLAERPDNKQSNMYEYKPIPAQKIRKGKKIPASFMQKLFCTDIDNGICDTGYNQTHPFILHGHIDVTIFKKTLQEILDRHDSLRINMGKSDGYFFIKPNCHTEINFYFSDLLEKLKRDVVDDDLQRMVINERRHVIDIYDEPLFKVLLYKATEDLHLMILNFHHLVIDAQSLHIIKKELGIIYNSFLKNENHNLPVPPLSYTDFTFWQSEAFQNKLFQNQLSYWKEEMAGFRFGKKLPPEKVDYHKSQNNIGLSIPMSRDTIADIKSFCAKKSITLFTFFMSVFHIAYHCYSDIKDLIVCALTESRNRPELQNLVGLYKDGLLIRSKINPFKTIDATVAQIAQTILSAHLNSDVSLGSLIEINKLNLDDEDLLLMLNYIDKSESILELHNLTVEPFVLKNPTSNSLENFRRLYLVVVINNSDISLYMSAHPRFLKKENIEKISSYCQLVMEKLLSTPQETVNEIILD